MLQLAVAELHTVEKQQAWQDSFVVELSESKKRFKTNTVVNELAL